MSEDEKYENCITSKIWYEEPEADNPFAAKSCLCHGYDVYGELLQRATPMQYLLLLFLGERPEPWRERMMETLWMALANPGPRDHSVRAAMKGGVGGSGAAASLMAALAVGAGGLGGAREVFEAMKWWAALGPDLEKWRRWIAEPPREERMDVWPEMEHPPGFDPNGLSCPTPVRETLRRLVEAGGDEAVALAWLAERREELEAATKMPLAVSGVAAAALHDLGLTPDQGEMLYLLLRLPGAAVHALEQRGLKFIWKNYPFWMDGLELSNDPGPVVRSEGE